MVLILTVSSTFNEVGQALHKKIYADTQVTAQKTHCVFTFSPIHSFMASTLRKENGREVEKI